MTQNKKKILPLSRFQRNWIDSILYLWWWRPGRRYQTKEWVCVWREWSEEKLRTELMYVVGFFPSPDIRSRPVRQTSPHFGARTSNSGPEVTSQQTTYETTTTTGTPPDPEQEDIVVERALPFDALSFSINRHGPKVWLQFFKHKDTTNIDMVVKIIDANVNWHWMGMVNLLFLPFMKIKVPIDNLWWKVSRYMYYVEGFFNVILNFYFMILSNSSTTDVQFSLMSIAQRSFTYLYQISGNLAIGCSKSLGLLSRGM